jgi:oligopeptide transport system ATP-binding protein
MALFSEQLAESSTGLILITHDLGVVADIADKIAVMYAGKIVEQAPVHDIYANPAHPYTEGLLASIPRVDRKGQELYAIKGLPPTLTNKPPGCPFNPRCPYVRPEHCTKDDPPLYEIGHRRTSACHYWEEVLDGQPHA